MHSARGKRFPAALALCALAGCHGLAQEREPEPRFPHLRPALEPTLPSASREWFRFALGFADRRQARGDPLDDAVHFGVDGGFDLSTRDALTPSVELGFGWSPVHVDRPGADTLDLFRATAGMRLTWYAEGWRPYVRGGGFLRWTDESADPPLDPYATGWFAGAGIDWPYQPGMTLGPAVTWLRGTGGDGADEWLFTLGATFRM